MGDSVRVPCVGHDAACVCVSVCMFLSLRLAGQAVQ